MIGLMETLSLLMSAYGAYGMLTGSIWAKKGVIGMEKIERGEQPFQFWFITITYLLMGQFLFWSLRHYVAGLQA